MSEISEFNKLKILSKNGTILRAGDVILSSNQYNDFTAMMLGIHNSTGHYNKIDFMDKSGLSNDQLSLISSIGVMQLSEDISGDNKFYYFIRDSIKLILLYLNKSETQVQFFKVENETEELLSTLNLFTILPEADSINKIVLITSSPDKLSNISVSIHETSMIPHHDLDSKLITGNNYWKIYTESLLKGFDLTYNNIKLGDTSTTVEVELTPSISTFNNKIIIR